jgi:type IV pilus assembly protein PilQ
MRMGNVIRVAPVEVLKSEQEQLLSSKRTKEKLEDLETQLIPVNYSTAAELQAQVKNILSERGSISIDARTNTLIIKDIPTVVAEATVLVERLDTRTPQVVIEARIVEAATNFSRELGIKWGGTSDTVELGGGPGTIGIEGSAPGASPADTVADFAIDGATSAITFNLADLGSIANLDIELSALEEAGEGEIISAPRITTLDNKEASIEQGLRIPYLKLTAEGTATTEFIEANIKLIVTPHVTNDGHIKMTIKASKDSPDDSITVQGVPAIDKKEAITEVLVENGDVVVIAGLYSIEKANNVDRIPLLGNVPLLGALFKSTEVTDDRRDLLIFISPKIVQQTV